MAIKIEEGIPVPSRLTSEIREAVEALQVGQSFALPLKRIGYLRMVASLAKARMKAAYVVRATSDSECRIWRSA